MGRLLRWGGLSLFAAVTLTGGGWAQDSGGPPDISDLCPSRVPPDREFPVLVHGENLDSATFSIGSESLTILAHCGTTVFVRCPSLPAGNHTLKVTCPGGTTTRPIVVGPLEGLSCIQILGCLAKALDDALMAGCIEHMGIHASLKTKLTQAVESLQSNRPKTALRQAGAFAHELEAQSGNGIDAGVADALLRIVREILIPCIEEEEGDGCTLVCKGSSTEPEIDLTDSKIFITSDDPLGVKRDGEVRNSELRFGHLLHDRHIGQRKAANCDGFMGNSVTLDIVEASSTSVAGGASCASVGRGDANLAVNTKESTLRFVDTAVATDPLDPLQSLAKGSWQTTLECVPPDEKEVDCKTEVILLRFGAGQGDSEILKSPSEAQAKAVQLLKEAIKVILKILKEYIVRRLPPVLGPAAEALFDYLIDKGVELIFQFSAKLKGQSVTNLGITTNLDEKTVGGQAKTSASHEQDKDGKLVDQVISDEGFCQVDFKTGNHKKLHVEAKGLTQNHMLATGSDLEGVSATSNAWAVVAVMKCDNEVRSARIYDGFAFDFVGKSGQSELPRMSEFLEFFDAQSGHVDNLILDEEWEKLQREGKFEELKKRVEMLNVELEKACEQNKAKFAKSTVKNP